MAKNYPQGFLCVECHAEYTAPREIGSNIPMLSTCEKCGAADSATPMTVRERKTPLPSPVKLDKRSPVS